MDRGKVYEFEASEEDLGCLDMICAELRFITDNVQYDENDGRFKLNVFCTKEQYDALLVLLDRIKHIAA